MKRLLFAWLALNLWTADAQSATRAVDLSWTASPSTPILGYNISRAAAATGPFTLLNAAPVAALVYTDAAVTVGQTYWYQVTTVASPCTPTTAVGQPCGESAPASASTTVPPKPTVVVTVTVMVK